MILCAVVHSRTMSVCIHNGWVLPMTPGSTAIEAGYVVIEDDRITEVGGGRPPRADTAIDARSGIVMPGMVNAHTHLGMALFRSLADDRADRLRSVLFPLESRVVTAELVYHATLHALLELIEGGVTTFADMYYFEEESARAAHEAGVRGILGETIVNFPAPDQPEPYGGLDRVRSLAAAWKDDPLITPAIAPHAPYTVNDENLLRCVDIAKELDIPMMMHLAEMPFEVEAIRDAHGVSPVRHMHDIGVLTRRLVAAHCVFTDDEDHHLLAEHDVGVVHNPIANSKGGKGFAPAQAMAEAGIRLGLATDGPMSGNRLDMFPVMRTAAYIHKAIARSATVFPAREIVELATIGGARALHMDDRIGTLEPGKQADLIVISTDAVALQPLHDPWSAVVYGASAADVVTSIVAGRILMRDRVIDHLDRSAVLARSRRIGAEVRAVLSDL